MKAFIKHTLLLVAALSLVSCRKDTVTEKWVLAEYTCNSDMLDQRFTYQYDAQGRLVQVKENIEYYVLYLQRLVNEEVQISNHPEDEKAGYG